MSKLKEPGSEMNQSTVLSCQGSRERVLGASMRDPSASYFPSRQTSVEVGEC